SGRHFFRRRHEVATSLPQCGPGPDDRREAGCHAGGAVIFDLSTLHLGDVLMALPAMREGDAVVTRHRVPGAPVEWIDPEAAPPARERTYPAMRRGRHTTDAWLESTGRAPVRHRLAPESDKRQIVIAPAV